MQDTTEPEDAGSALRRLGLAVPESNLAFLSRTLQRQRQTLAGWTQVPAHTEPALVFRVEPPVERRGAPDRDPP
jgi:hypothetical protein